MLKVLVPIKRVVDYNVRVRAAADGSSVNVAGVKMSINPFDEIALEEAIRLKEKGVASELTVISIGDSQCIETIRHALALGADKGVLVQTDNSNSTLEPLAIAKLLKGIADEEKPDLVMMGKQAIDDDAGQTGQMLAALLQWSQGTFASKLEVQDSHILVTREVDTGLMTVKLKLPSVITTDLRLNEPRYATLPNIMKAKSKPVKTIPVSELGVDVSPRLQYLKYEEPTKRAAGTMVASVQELIEKLKQEARIL